MKVRAAAEKALEKVRSGKGPHLLEFVTYRYRGHSMGDPERYRKKAEVQKWEESDPIGIYRKYLTKEGIASAKALDAVEKRAEQDVQKAVEFAEASPEPAPEELFSDVYAEEV
jgi:pyruvate dehydrogenase E1 component alpha subunit